MQSRKPYFYPAEVIAGAVILCLAILVVALSTARGTEIQLASFAKHGFVAALLFTISAYYRVIGRDLNIPLALISCAILTLFSNFGATLNYLLIAPGTTTVDAVLFRADALIGFDWVRFASAVGEFPRFGHLLGLIYQSSLFQMAGVIILLGLTGRQVALHRFVLTGVFASCASLAIWAFMPSFGPAASLKLDPALDARLGRIVDSGYGAKLVALARDGVSQIDSESIIGLIAFPSMHTVMAAMSVWYTRGTRAFWPLLVINTLMIPAILVHGGHHLVDVLGGSVLFAAVTVAVSKMIPDGDQLHTAPGGRLIRMASMLPPVLRPNSVPRS